MVFTPRKKKTNARVAAKLNVTRPTTTKVQQPPQAVGSNSMPRNVIPKTKVEDIPKDGLIVINGRKASGKTFMCHWLLSVMAHEFDGGMFISDSIHTIKQWRKNIPKSFIFNGVDMEKLENWTHEVKRRNDRRVERDLPMRRYLLILDDIGYDSKLINSKAMIRVIQNARQVGVSVWIITQYLYQLHLQLRDAIDFAICFRETSPKALKKIKEDIFAELGDDFDGVFKAGTGQSDKQRPNETKEEYGRRCPPRALCINKRKQGVDTWQDCVSCVKANYLDVEKPWRLANQVYYILDEMAFQSEAEKRSKDEALKNAYAQSEIGLQPYNDDFLDKLKGSGAEFVIEDDYDCAADATEEGN